MKRTKKPAAMRDDTGWWSRKTWGGRTREQRRLNRGGARAVRKRTARALIAEQS